MVRGFTFLWLMAIAALGLSIAGCKKIDIGTTTIKAAKLTLATPGAVTIAGPQLSCQSDVDLNSEFFTYGFCYDTTRLPVIPGRAEAATNFAAGEFSLVLPNVPFGYKYFVRAFVTNGSAVSYSNVDSFYMPAFLNTGSITQITPNAFKASISRLADTAPFDQWGICYSTKRNPGLQQFTRLIGGSNLLSEQIAVSDTLKPATVYYLRSVIVKEGVPYYGNEVSFTTAGYRGGSGGYVLYDKGDTTGGWRYVEASLDTTRARGSTWGCAGTLIPGITTGLGTGLGNSENIIAACTQTGIAAAVCRNLRRSTKTDWYLPDTAELRLYQYLRSTKVITKRYRLFSSTQANANQYVMLDSAGNFINAAKTDTSAFILPMRRF